MFNKNITLDVENLTPVISKSGNQGGGNQAIRVLGENAFFGCGSDFTEAAMPDRCAARHVLRSTVYGTSCANE